MEITIRQLNKTEAIPYHLLLLADETREAINKYIFDTEIYVGEKGKQMIAVYVLKITKSDTVEIKNIAVDTAYQGLGIGSKLLNFAFENAASRNFRVMLIGTSDVASKQLVLYKRLGFTEFKIIKNFFIENYSAPIFQHGQQLKDMVLLKKNLQ